MLAAYSNIDERVQPLGYALKYFAKVLWLRVATAGAFRLLCHNFCCTIISITKFVIVLQTCDIGDASTGSLSSYAYIIILIHYLQRLRPPVLPVLQEVREFVTSILCYVYQFVYAAWTRGQWRICYWWLELLLFHIWLSTRPGMFLMSSNFSSNHWQSLAVS